MHLSIDHCIVNRKIECNEDIYVLQLVAQEDIDTMRGWDVDTMRVVTGYK